MFTKSGIHNAISEGKAVLAKKKISNALFLLLIFLCLIAVIVALKEFDLDLNTNAVTNETDTTWSITAVVSVTSENSTFPIAVSVILALLIGAVTIKFVNVNKWYLSAVVVAVIGTALNVIIQNILYTYDHGPVSLAESFVSFILIFAVSFFLIMMGNAYKYKKIADKQENESLQPHGAENEYLQTQDKEEES